MPGFVPEAQVIKMARVDFKLPSVLEMAKQTSDCNTEWEGHDGVCRRRCGRGERSKSVHSPREPFLKVVVFSLSPDGLEEWP